jgi:hypothetical protein
MFSVKVYVKDSEVLLAACDEELLGRTLRSDGIKLTVSRTFYHSETIGGEELRTMMRNATAMNLVGNRTVSAARELGLVSNAMIIEGAEYAQTVRM